ncbi:MAG: xylulose kinase, partial [Clostridia bacterium]|nr:xylulose kinase [Clostridia bacterium]
QILECSDTVCLGAAMLAGVASGVYASAQEAAENMVRTKAVIEPDPALYSAYQEQLERYLAFYPSLEKLRDAR